MRNIPGADLDAVDRKLMALLQANARESTALLARRLGLARTTVLARISRLEKSGTIAGYGVRLSSASLARVSAFVGISVLPKAGPQVESEVSKLMELEELCTVTGAFDFMAVLRCESTQDLDRVLDTIGQLEGVRQTHSSVVLRKKIDRRSV
jgi:DNA-binding Lrp family transcriptional regulator